MTCQIRRTRKYRFLLIKTRFLNNNHQKILCFSVVSRPAEAQVPIFTGQMKKASKKRQKSIVFFDFSNHAGAQLPIFTPKMNNFRFARLALPWALVSLGYTSKTQKSYFICTEKLFHLRLFSSDCTAGPDSGCGVGGGVRLAIQQW